MPDPDEHPVVAYMRRRSRISFLAALCLVLLIGAMVYAAMPR